MLKLKPIKSTISLSFTIVFKICSKQYVFLFFSGVLFKMSDFQLEPPSKQIRIDLITQAGLMDLPNEILKLIFLCLKTKNIHQTIAFVCKRFFELTRLPVFCETFHIEIKCELMDRDRIRKSCIERIEKLLKVFPDCNLQLQYNGECQYGTDEFFEAIEDLLPFQSSITDLALSFTGEGNLALSTQMICLENLKYLHLDLSKCVWHYREDVTDLPSVFWNNFPNLTSLKIENSCEDVVSISKMILVFASLVLPNNDFAPSHIYRILLISLNNSRN